MCLSLLMEHRFHMIEAARKGGLAMQKLCRKEAIGCKKRIKASFGETVGILMGLHLQLHL